MELHPTGAEADDVLLTMTEVVTNSVRHGEPPIHVELLDAARSLRMSISDASAELPRQRRCQTDSEESARHDPRGGAELPVGTRTHFSRRQDRVVHVHTAAGGSVGELPSGGGAQVRGIEGEAGRPFDDLLLLHGRSLLSSVRCVSRLLD